MAVELKRRARGRPAVHDHLPLYLYIETERRRRKLTIRALCAQRDTRFQRFDSSPSGTTTVTYVNRETLRRRYREAREVLGLTDPHPHVHSTAYDEYQKESRKLLDGIITGLLG